MMKETMPVILFRNGIPAPVGGFEILKDDAYVLILIAGRRSRHKNPFRAIPLAPCVLSETRDADRKYG